MYASDYIISYFVHRLRSLNLPAQDVFAQDFKNHICRKKLEPSEMALVEEYKTKLYQNNQLLEPVDFGAGSRKPGKFRTLGTVARNVSAGSRKGRILFNLARYYQPDIILELGTALGVSTMCLALGNPRSRIITIEGNPQLAKIAETGFSACHLKHITLIHGLFDDTLENIKQDLQHHALVYIDGNHTYEATLKYYRWFMKSMPDDCILVFDDIRWSLGMMQAWKEITGSAENSVIIDLFHLGILFRQGQNKSRTVYIRY